MGFLVLKIIKILSEKLSNSQFRLGYVKYIIQHFLPPGQERIVIVLLHGPSYTDIFTDNHQNVTFSPSVWAFTWVRPRTGSLVSLDCASISRMVYPTLTFSGTREEESVSFTSCAAAAVAVASPPAQGSDPHRRIPHQDFFILDFYFVQDIIVLLGQTVR